MRVLGLLYFGRFSEATCAKAGPRLGEILEITRMSGLLEQRPGVRMMSLTRQSGCNVARAGIGMLLLMVFFVPGNSAKDGKEMTGKSRALIHV